MIKIIATIIKLLSNTFGPPSSYTFLTLAQIYF
jgi:hypothetical protein